MPKSQLPAPLPEVKALRNPTPVRDLARGLAFRALPRAAQILADPNTKPADFIKLLETLMRFSLGQPSMQEVIAAASDQEVQDAKAAAMVKQALSDPAVQEWAERNKPELLRTLVTLAEAHPDVATELGEEVSPAEGA